MGGTIKASSRLGAGSVFTVKLPLERLAASKAALPEAIVEVAQPEREVLEEPTELRVLAAEDNLTNQLVLKTLLAPAGVEPVLVADGRQALEAWEGQTWDIILMDIQMPEMDGVEATQAIRRREREIGRARTPIIAVTANAMTHQAAEYLDAGMDDVVSKPVQIANLFAAMEAALASRRGGGGRLGQSAEPSTPHRLTFFPSSVIAGRQSPRPMSVGRGVAAGRGHGGSVLGWPGTFARA